MTWSLIRAIYPEGDTPSVRQFVTNQVEVSVDQILRAKTTVMGRYRLWAGKVIQQIVRFAPDLPALPKPAFTQTGHQGMTYLVVTSAKQATSDEHMLAIGRYLSNEEKRMGHRGEVFVWVWTDRRQAATKIPMSDAESGSLVAQVHINPSKGVEKVDRPNR